MNKKISFFIGHLVGNGAENVCVTVANYFINIGYIVDLVVLTLNKSEIHTRLDKRINLVNLNCNKKALFYKLFGYVKNNKPDIIFSFEPVYTASFLFVRLLTNKKFKIVTRCINTLSIQKQYMKKSVHNSICYLITKMFLRFSDLVIAQCNGMKKDLIEHFNISGSKIVTIYNPIRENIFNAYNEDNTLKKEYILCVGRLNVQKAFDIAIKSFNVFSAKHPNVKLLIAGRGEQKEYLESLILKLDLCNRIKLVNYTKEIEKLYANATFTLLTSLVEGFPNVLLESIALGIPIVSVNCPSGPSEIILNGVNGYLIKTRDIKAISTFMDLAYKRKWDKSKIRNTALKFSQNNLLPQYAKQISKIIG